jgi:hypothetical protein
MPRSSRSIKGILERSFLSFRLTMFCSMYMVIYLHICIINNEYSTRTLCTLLPLCKNIDNMRKAILVFDHVYFIKPVIYADNAPMSDVNAPRPMNKSITLEDEFNI